MKKVLLNSILLLCALIVGSMNVWGDDPTEVTINFGTTTGYWAAHTNDDEHSTYTDSDSREWARTFSANSTSSGQAGYSQFGNSSNTCTSLVFTATVGENMTVTEFSVTMAGASGGKSPTTGTIYLYKRTESGAETQLATASVSGSDGVTCSITSNQTFSSTDILKVSYVGTAKAIRISSLSYSYIAGGDPVPSVSLTTYTINESYTAVSTKSIDVTYENISNYEADVIFYESDGTTAATYDHSWITAAINSTTKNLDYSMAANTGAARTAYLKIYALGDGDAEAYSNLVTITQAKAVVNYTYSSATAIVPGKHYIITSGTSGTVNAMGADRGNNHGSVEISISGVTKKASISTDDGVCELLISADISTGLYTLYDAEEEKYISAASSGSNNMKYVTELDNDARWAISFDESGNAIIQSQGDYTRNTIRHNSGNNPPLFSCYASDKQSPVYLFERDGDTGSQEVSVSIAEACTDGSKYYATYSSPFGFIIPSGLTVEEIGIDNEGKLDVQAYSAGVRVPANTGVLISSTTAGSKTLTLAGGGTSVLDDDNRLRATGTGITADEMAAADASCKYYRLTMHGQIVDNEHPENNAPGTIGFWWGAENGAKFALGANKAYLAVPNALANLAPMRFWFEDEENNATNIEAIESSDKAVKFIENGKLLIKKDGIVYDALGRVIR